MKPLREKILACDDDVLMFFETWLSADIDSAQLNFVNFSIFRCDRSRDGGRVLSAIPFGYTCTVIQNPDKSVEQVWVLTSHGSQSRVYFAAYTSLQPLLLPPTNVSVILL